MFDKQFIREFWSQRQYWRLVTMTKHIVQFFKSWESK